jgi:hypothetical protein
MGVTEVKIVSNTAIPHRIPHRNPTTNGNHSICSLGLKNIEIQQYRKLVVGSIWWKVGPTGSGITKRLNVGILSYVSWTSVMYLFIADIGK